MGLIDNLGESVLLSRRGLLTGALVGGGLYVGWRLWPRRMAVGLATAPGETVLSGFIKIGKDGHVTVVTPQIEMGQGSYTLMAQVIADELGADWRTIAVEPAPLHPDYDNDLVAGEWGEGRWTTPKLQATGNSSSLRAFEPRLRAAAAGARTLLAMAAASKWDASWEACDAEGGFIIRGADKARFGDLAEAAAGFALPHSIPMRTSGPRLAGRGVDRLDLPAKLDGSANYAADIRLPDMVYSAIRQGPPGDTRLTGFDRKAAASIEGLLSVVDHPRWLAAIANSWWTANSALDTLRPGFSTVRAASDASTAKALQTALGQPGKVITETGDVEALFVGVKPVVRDYAIGFAPHAALEPLSATAAIDGEKMQLWIATQSPGLARTAAAKAIGMREDQVTVHAMQIGGSFGRKYEVDIAGQVAILARKMARPVQLIWSRSEDMTQDRFRPAARARLSARLEAAGQVAAWQADIATADGVGEMVARNLDGMQPVAAQRQAANTAAARAVEGATPPYLIQAQKISHHPADLGVPTGKLRGGANGASAFFTESFIDELAHEAKRDPFSMRMGLLSQMPRLALCLSRVTTLGGWDGGNQGTRQGLACHVMQGSHIAVLAEAQIGDDQRVRVTKLVAVVDAGRIMNPDIARQQIEGGLLYGMGLAVGAPIRFDKGTPFPQRLGALGLPLLASMPEISVELVRSSEAPGGLGEIAVPPVGPAIANALFAGSGRRFRTLPINAAGSLGATGR
jgi:isoquinoline 1-oxidoreductase subunit beta